MSTKVLQENKMGVMPVGRLLANMALPVIISMFVQALYNVVDSIYVSQVSESAVTALSLAFPIQNLQVGFAVGIAIGVNSLLSKKLGEGDQEGTNRAAGNGLVLAGISVVLFMLFGIFCTRPYFEMQSDVAETVEGGILYSRICTIFSVGMFVQILTEKLLQATGRTMYTMVIQGTGAILNIILDPLFIHGWAFIPAMGVAGAAVATVLGQWIGAGVGLYFAIRHNPEVKMTRDCLRPHRETIHAILAVGIPGIVMNCIGSVMCFGMNQILQGFTETATGVFGIYFKLQSFFFMPLFGINSAAISIVAYNYGARKPERIVRTMKLACGTALMIMVAGLVIFQVAPDLLLGMFNPSPEFLDIGRGALRTISWCFPAAAFGVVLGAVFQALGNGIYTTMVSLCRQLLVLLPTAYLLSLSGNVNLVWLSFLIAEVASAAVTLYYFLRIYRKKIKPLYAN